MIFQLKFKTQFGESLYLLGNHPDLGGDVLENAIPLLYLNEELWFVELPNPTEWLGDGWMHYRYVLKYPDGTIAFDASNDKKLDLNLLQEKDMVLMDSWNYEGYVENVFYTNPFKNVLIINHLSTIEIEEPNTFTYHFKVKAPLLQKGETVVLLGNHPSLHNWDTKSPILLSKQHKEPYYEVKLNLGKTRFPIAYKYGIYNLASQRFVRYETGNNRIVHNDAGADKIVIVHDGFIRIPVEHWKGAGLAIPVFSLRSETGWGIGEFADLKLLADWCNRVGLKMIQLLPVNDTTVQHNWMDSYPYAAVSAFALHPLYLHVDEMVSPSNKSILEKYALERDRLNQATSLNYEGVSNLKWTIFQEIYFVEKDNVFQTADYQQFFENNQHWLRPYALFSHYRDWYGTADFQKWEMHQHFNTIDLDVATDPSNHYYDEIAIHYFLQYNLHIQLKAAKEYAHQKGVILKGDLPIGIGRLSADAWQQPLLFKMNLQAGAPPDDFAVKGQNWGFPTYHWENMQKDGFRWWKERLKQMETYFDAFRIDHILGFFRILSIPTHAVEGILGHFEPAIPITKEELDRQGLWVSEERFTKPYITDTVLWEIFGYDTGEIVKHYLEHIPWGCYALKPEFDTQQKVDEFFRQQPDTDLNRKIKMGLFDLISNVILLSVEDQNETEFHFRFGMEKTYSFSYLEASLKDKLKALYHDYFFVRQEKGWMQHARQLLPFLKMSTNMLLFGEDLGLIPPCVPELMNQLGILSLEIQRMPKASNKAFFHPNDAPYLSVVSPSTHDMSSIRGWWEEDRTKTQRFYNQIMGKYGNAPYYAEPWIVRSIVLQHLYSTAMWSVFLLQDLLGIDGDLRLEKPQDERINVPANPKNYWQWRMHLQLENLLQDQDFNTQLGKLIKESGR